MHSTSVLLPLGKKWPKRKALHCFTLWHLRQSGWIRQWILNLYWDILVPQYQYPIHLLFILCALATIIGESFSFSLNLPWAPKLKPCSSSNHCYTYCYEFEIHNVFLIFHLQWHLKNNNFPLYMRVCTHLSFGFCLWAGCTI